MKNITGSSQFLRTTLLAGLLLLILSGIVLTVLFLSERNASRESRQLDSFSRILREYDVTLEESFGTEREFDYLNNMLDRLERNAIGVESWLSLLKRRRALSYQYPPFLSNYRRSVANALAVYPASEPIIAIAAAALVKNSALTNEADLQLRQWLSKINSPSFNTFRLSFHVLLGDFRNPQRALSIPTDIVSNNDESISVNFAILNILRRDFRSAASDILTLLHHSPSDNTLRFTAEYHYDFGDLIRSAQLFSLINDTSANVRQADALYLAGYYESAKSIWGILADSLDETSLYNLAMLALEQEQISQATTYLEKLVRETSQTRPDSLSAINARQFGLIRYSRLLPSQQAVRILQTTDFFPPANFPFIDLELCKRNSQQWPLGRQIAETWMLLDRHPNNKDLYEWAAWHLFFQRRFDETPIILNRLSMLQFSDETETKPWIDIYRALQFMIDGNLDAAENIFLSIPANKTNWVVHANLGRIYEERRSSSRALAQYEQAAIKAQDDRTKSRILLRAARCLTTLGRRSEAYSVLLTALEYDPDNMSARLELERGMY
jgi:tetratricopeptide (TPR) repeat protein